jgi:hypothetical protein
MQIISTYIGHSNELGCAAGCLMNPSAVVRDAETAKVFTVTKTAHKYVVWDPKHDETTRGSTWTTSGNGYVYGTYPPGAAVRRTMHSIVMELDGTVVPPDHTIDHINRIKTDNRRENLRVVRQSIQNENRDDRSDRKPPPPPLVALGVSRMPRYMRWEDSEKKFTGSDHPMAKTGGVNLTGSKARDMSILGKFQNCTQKFCDMYDRWHGDADAEADAELRLRLSAEYNRVTKFVHESMPSLVPEADYVDLDDILSEPAFCRALNDRLVRLMEVEPTVTHGSLNGDTTYRRLRTARIFALDWSSKGRKDGDVTVTTLFDAVHEDEARALYGLSKWDSTGSSPSLHVTRELEARHPSLRGVKKVRLADFVYEHVLRKGPVPVGKTIVPLNYKPYDLREANLLLMDGESGKAFKSPKTLATPAVLADDPVFAPYLETFRCLPRGVTLLTNGARGYNYQFGKGSPSSDTGNIAVPVKGVGNAFLAKVLPRMRANDPTFDATNTLYQEMVRSYEAAQLAA